MVKKVEKSGDHDISAPSVYQHQVSLKTITFYERSTDSKKSASFSFINIIHIGR